MEHAHRGEAALTANKYDEAISHYTLALKAQPTSPTYYVKRSTAYQRTKQLDLALSDAEMAVGLAAQRAKRELISQAQLRRGISLFQLGQYANANFCFGVAKKFNDKEKSVDMWKHQAESKLKGLSGEELKVTVKELPNVQVDPIEEEVEMEKEKDNRNPNSEMTGQTRANAAETQLQQTPKEKIRHEWYQSNEKVTITLLAKGVPKDKATIHIHPTSVDVSFPLPNSSTFDLSLDPLFAPVKVEESSYSVKSTKIEIELRKRQPGQKWASLEGTEPASTSAVANATDNDDKLKAATGPAYPTSSRSGPKNWDKIAQSYQKPSPSDPNKDNGGKEDEEDKEAEDIYVDDYEDGDPANAFFKKLYAGADPDTKRAMMKSFQESGGTALSTDWNEVRKKKVEVSPPDGMEEKKWES